MGSLSSPVCAQPGLWGAHSAELGPGHPFHHRSSPKWSLLSRRYNLPLSSSRCCLAHALLSHVTRLCVAHHQHSAACASPANLVSGDATSLLSSASIKLASVFRTRQHTPAHTVLSSALLTSLPELHTPSTTLAHPQHIPCHQPDTVHVSALNPCKYKGKDLASSHTCPCQARLGLRFTLAGILSHPGSVSTSPHLLLSSACTGQVLVRERCLWALLLSKVLCSNQPESGSLLGCRGGHQLLQDHLP